MVALATAFVALAGVFCVRDAATTARLPKEALGRLTEDEVVLLIKAGPALRGALKAAKWRHNPGSDNEPGLATTIESYNVPGMDDSLRQYGGWAKVRLILYKVKAAESAFRWDRVPPGSVELMGRDTLMSAIRAACRRIPKANKQLVAKYEDQLFLLTSTAPGIPHPQ